MILPERICLGASPPLSINPEDGLRIKHDLSYSFKSLTSKFFRPQFDPITRIIRRDNSLTRGTFTSEAIWRCQSNVELARNPGKLGHPGCLTESLDSDVATRILSTALPTGVAEFGRHGSCSGRIRQPQDRTLGTIQPTGERPKLHPKIRFRARFCCIFRGSIGRL